MFGPKRLTFQQPLFGGLANDWKLTPLKKTVAERFRRMQPSFSRLKKPDGRKGQLGKGGRFGLSLFLAE
jgi:hypothetical protein